MMMATASPESPGNEINRKSTPDTTNKARINKKPCKAESILKAARSAKRTNVIARIFINMHKDA